MKTCKMHGCTERANNVSMTKCNAHVDAFRAAENEFTQATERLLRASVPYFIPQLDCGQIDEDCGQFLNCDVSSTQAETLAEFREDLQYSAVDQDGGEAYVGGWDDAPLNVREAIARALGNGITVDDIETAQPGEGETK